MNALFSSVNAVLREPKWLSNCKRITPGGLVTLFSYGKHPEVNVSRSWVGKENLTICSDCLSPESHVS